MVTSFSCLGRSSESRPFWLQPVFAIALTAAFVAGCGGGSNNGSNPVVSGNTSVVVLASSTANDQMNAFQVTIESLTLTSKSGEQVTLLASPVIEEYIHLNGHVEPLATVSIPQGVYVSAAATFGSNIPGCAGQTPGDDFLNQMTGGPGTVNLPNPITVTGTAMGLVLNLQVANYPGGCPTPAMYVTAPPVTASFNLTPMTFAAPPTNSANGMALGLEGTISSVDANGEGVVVSALVNGAEPLLNPPSWHATLNGNTMFQGIAGASQLTPGLPVDMDLAIQPDGSFLATRIEVISTNTTTLTVANGPLMTVSNVEPVTFVIGATQQGYLTPFQIEDGFGYVNFGNAAFQTSGQFSNLASLPFTASFNGANIVPGQNVTITTQATAVAGGPGYIPLTTMTLRPQTINGTVSAISSQGNFTAYTVTLAPYDLFPQFAVQPGQATLLTNPSTVVVYADNNTQMLNSNPVSAGGVFRFYGLVFNDQGTLSMDCAEINDGAME